MNFEKEYVTAEEAKRIIDEYKEGYILDGFDEKISKSMAIANFNLEYEII